MRHEVDLKDLIFYISILMILICVFIWAATVQDADKEAIESRPTELENKLEGVNGPSVWIDNKKNTFSVKRIEMNEPIFTIREPNNKEYNIYLDGKIDGFEDSPIVFTQISPLSDYPFDLSKRKFSETEIEIMKDMVEEDIREMREMGFIHASSVVVVNKRFQKHEDNAL